MAEEAKEAVEVAESAEGAAPASAGAHDGRLACDGNAPADVREAFQGLVDTIWRLRQPDGCPWDRKQTHESIAKNMIEEAYEAIDCIEAGDAGHLREELGDVLMQVVLHAQIAADDGEFTCADVVRDIDEKLIRRHPHVFGSAEARDAEDVLGIWDAVKLKEKAARDADAQGGSQGAEGACKPEGLLDSVPRSLPALMEAQKVSRKAAAVGFEWDSVADVWDKVAEERAEFEREPADSDGRALEFGDILFALVNVARLEGIDAESALRASTAKFRARWEAMEDRAFARGERMEDMGTARLNDEWDAVKCAAMRAAEGEDEPAL